MNIKKIKPGIIALILLLLLGIVGACGEYKPPVVPPQPSQPQVAPTPPAPSETTGESRVDVVYFHPKIRCASCNYVEIRTKYNLDKYFVAELASGKLTFTSIELTDKASSAIVKKYGAVGSQLFITTVKNGAETIKHIDEVWYPNILNDQPAFDELMQSLITKSLKEVK